MQYLAIALVWAAFILLLLATRKRSKTITLLFAVSVFLAVLALAVWGALRNI